MPHATAAPGKRGYKLAAAEAGAGELVTPHRALLDEGIPIALGTDNVPYNPFFSLWNAMAREGRNGEVVGPGQQLTAAEALPLLTREGAKLSFDERHKGMLRAGMLADFAVLDRDLLSTPPGDVEDVRADMTVVGGRIVHEA